jgi:hypothetical protein
VKILRVVDVNTVSGFSAAIGAAVVACVIAVAYAQANERVPDVASISAASAVPLVSDDVLIVAGFPAFLCVSLKLSAFLLLLSFLLLMAFPLLLLFLC